MTETDKKMSKSMGA